MSTDAPAAVAEHPAPCPRCGCAPEIRKVGSYWHTRCPTPHLLLQRVTGHPMRTKQAAIREWNQAVQAIAATLIQEVLR